MKRYLLTSLIIVFCTGLFAQIQPKIEIKKVPHRKEYIFKYENSFKITYFDKKGNVRAEHNYKTFHNNDFKYFMTYLDRTERHAIFDIENLSNINYFGSTPAEKIEMTSVVKMQDLNKTSRGTLQLEETSETKKILGYNCVKYTFTESQFTGELWVAKSLKDINNDLGIVKASRLGKYFKDVETDGFVLEITSYNKKGKKTLMETTAFSLPKNLKVIIPKDITHASNKINYYNN